MDPLSRYLKPAPKPQTVLRVVTVLSFVLSAWGCFAIYEDYTRIQQEKSGLLVLQQRARPVHVAEPTRNEREEAAQWKNVRGELAFSWYPIFAALEHTTSPDIALLEFLPDKSAARLTLRGNARDVESLVTYLNALNSEKAFSEVYLSHQKTLRQAGLVSLDFEIRIKLR